MCVYLFDYSVTFQTGYMFGKGIYFADMVSKSANYCYTSKSNPTGLLLLCEVALGNELVTFFVPCLLHQVTFTIAQYRFNRRDAGSLSKIEKGISVWACTHSITS